MTIIKPVPPGPLRSDGVIFPPNQVVLETGACTTPKIGVHLFLFRLINAIFTVNIPFLLINSFVPSNGSTNQQVSEVSGFPSFPSSDTIGVLSIFFNSSTMRLWAAKSASVKGDLSLLCSILIFSDLL